MATKFWRQLNRRTVFRKWKDHTDRTWNERKAKADECYRRHCLMVGMTLLRKFYYIEHSKRLVADDWYEMRLTERVIRSWNGVTAQMRMLFEIKRKQADAHYNWYISSTSTSFTFITECNC